MALAAQTVEFSHSSTSYYNALKKTPLKPNPHPLTIFHYCPRTETERAFKDEDNSYFSEFNLHQYSRTHSEACNTQGYSSFLHHQQLPSIQTFLKNLVSINFSSTGSGCTSTFNSSYCFCFALGTCFLPLSTVHMH